MNKQILTYLLFFLFALGEIEGQNIAIKHWIYFTDKGPAVVAQSAAAFKRAEQNITRRALLRRAKVKKDGQLLDQYDLPLYDQYLQTVKKFGGHIVMESRWLNACSVYLNAAQIEQLRSLPFVARIVPVRTMVAPPAVDSGQAVLIKQKQDLPETQFDYGASLDQIAQINVHQLHNADIAGANVLIGLLDSGFNYKGHEAFSHLQVEGEYDFVFGDSVTANEEGDISSQHSHGTQVLSVAAGFAPGDLIGPAFRARFLLAKTEDLRSETPAEEDNWVAAIEWMESRGIDVASTSLGYSDFDEPWTDYSWSDLDGNTATVTIAAQIATEKGVVVVSSAGNEGNDTWRYVTPPADARDVITVGAVQKSGERSYFSSIGPSFYSRLKPDVMALGSNVTMVVPRNKGYTTNGGTSFAAPLVAGVVAQILSVHPDLEPAQVMEALHNTASRANAPDSLFGWGIIDARWAITYWGPAFGPVFHVNKTTNTSAVLSVGFLGGPEIDSTSIVMHWRPERASAYSSASMLPIGMAQYQSTEIHISPDELTYFYLTVANKAGDLFYYPDSATGEIFTMDYLGRVAGHDESRLLPANPTDNFYLFHPFPNPFIAAGENVIRFAYDLTATAEVELTVYNVLGQEVARPLKNILLVAGKGFVDWAGDDAHGEKVATGVYFLMAKFRQMNGKVVIKRRKLLLLN